MINSKTTVYLQTAGAYIFVYSSKRNYVVKVILDPGSQQTYILQFSKVLSYLQSE